MHVTACHVLGYPGQLQGFVTCSMLSKMRWHTAQVREREAEIDSVIGPIEEMYALLTRYEVRCAASSF